LQLVLAVVMWKEIPDSDRLLPQLRQKICQKDNIEKAIKKGTGELEGAAAYEEVVYEGYGPSGVAVLIEVMTDNRNRTVAEIRHIFSKYGGNLGENGCVAWMFEKREVSSSVKIVLMKIT